MASTHVYSLDEFRAQYQLDPQKAERLYRVSGPAKADLDTLMFAHRRRRALEADILNVQHTPPRS